MIKIGDTINGRYKVVGNLGEGGMSTVYEVRDPIFRRHCALKIIKPECATKIENIIRFQNEARFLASFNHPNIVKIYDYGEYNNLPYFICEYINSQTIRDVLDYKRNFSLKEASGIMIQLCDAVSCIHEHNIIHRDIKSQNIYYSYDGSIKLADFGISILLGSKINLNENKKIMGTVQYLAPEIIHGKKPLFQSDIYSMGITFYELLTGKVPFDGSNSDEVARMHLDKKMLSPLKINPTLPFEVERIVFKATEKDPKKRYQSAKDFKEDILSLFDEKDKKKGFKGLFGK